MSLPSPQCVYRLVRYFEPGSDAVLMLTAIGMAIDCCASEAEARERQDAVIAAAAAQLELVGEVLGRTFELDVLENLVAICLDPSQIVH